MRRRDMMLVAWIALCGSAAWGQPSQEPKTIGVLTGAAEDDPGIRRSIEELRQALQTRGWREGDNLQLIYRSAAGEAERVQRLATEFVRLRPDLIVAHNALVVAALHRITRTVPIVFVSIPDPVANGFVVSLPRTGGNMTGFTNYDFWPPPSTRVPPLRSRAPRACAPSQRGRGQSQDRRRGPDRRLRSRQDTWSASLRSPRRKRPARRRTLPIGAARIDPST
jgi:ABC transporter substrate binding protein